MTAPTPCAPLVRPNVDIDKVTHPWDFRCPICGRWGSIDQQQYEGTVSIDHTQYEDRETPTGCTFHQHIDCRTIQHLEAGETA